MILVFGNIIYKGRTVDNRLQMMEGGKYSYTTEP